METNVKKVEAVARRLARMDGQNPDALVICPNPIGQIPFIINGHATYGKTHQLPVWRLYEKDADRALWALMLCEQEGELEGVS